MADAPKTTAETQPLPPKVEGEKQAVPAAEPVQQESIDHRKARIALDAAKAKKETLLNAIEARKELQGRMKKDAIKVAMDGVIYDTNLLQQKITARLNEIKKLSPDQKAQPDISDDLIHLANIEREAETLKRDATLADNSLSSLGYLLAKAGDGLGYAGGFLASGAEVVWKYTLGPLFHSIGGMSEQPRAALADWLRTAKYVPGGAFLAGLIHKGSVAKSPEQVQSADYDVLAKIYGSRITFNAQFDVATKGALLVQLDGIIGTYKGKDVRLAGTTRAGFINEVLKKPVSPLRVLSWEEFIDTANKFVESTPSVIAGAPAVVPATTVTQPPAVTPAPATAAPAAANPPPANS